MSARLTILLLSCVVAGCAATPPPAGTEPADGAALLREVETLMAGVTDEAEEVRVLDLLRRAAPEALEHVVRRVDLRKLLGDVDDHFLGPRRGAELLVLLARERVGELSITSRAALITALQVGSTDADDEVAVADVFLATHQGPPSRPSRTPSTRAGTTTTSRTSSSTTSTTPVRASIFRHFGREAAGAAAAEVKVLSDIDDTLYRNWVDERYPPRGRVPRRARAPPRAGPRTRRGGPRPRGGRGLPHRAARQPAASSRGRRSRRSAGSACRASSCSPAR